MDAIVDRRDFVKGAIGIAALFGLAKAKGGFNEDSGLASSNDDRDEDDNDNDGIEDESSSSTSSSVSIASSWCCPSNWREIMHRHKLTELKKVKLRKLRKRAKRFKRLARLKAKKARRKVKLNVFDLTRRRLN